VDQKQIVNSLILKAKRYRNFALSIGDIETARRILALTDELIQRARALARPDEALIRKRAQEIWDENGRPAGRDEEFWLQAEREANEGNGARCWLVRREGRRPGRGIVDEGRAGGQQRHGRGFQGCTDLGSGHTGAHAESRWRGVCSRLARNAGEVERRTKAEFNGIGELRAHITNRAG
jgi:Protein of unknown function (DUF2934)